MPRLTTPAPLQSGQAMLSWAAMALRMKALLLGSLLRKSANSSSTLNATIFVLGGLRGIGTSAYGRACLLLLYPRPHPLARRPSLLHRPHDQPIDVERPAPVVGVDQAEVISAVRRQGGLQAWVERA